MLLSIHLESAVEALERVEEFGFGTVFAWSCADQRSVNVSILVDVPRMVDRSKRRDIDARFGIGYCDSYPYTASGLIGVALANLSLEKVIQHKRGSLRIEFSSYPRTEYSEQIASRLFKPIGYSVEVANRKLILAGYRFLPDAIRELSVLLLALDRRSRLFLESEDLDSIRAYGVGLLSDHPAKRGIALAIEGKPTALRLLIPPGEPGRELTRETNSSVVPELPLLQGYSLRQREHALRMFTQMNIDRRWLIYLPSGIASMQTKTASGDLESVEEAFNYYRDEQIETVVVEEKHMGSRAIVVLCRDVDAAKQRFGVEGEIPGCVYTRNGRKFFSDGDTEAVFIDRVQEVLSRSNFWTRFSTDWVCLDGEIKPWAIKASESSEDSDLVEAGKAALGATAELLGRDSETKVYWQQQIDTELAALDGYDSLFKHYRKQDSSLSSWEFAPFHILATEGHTYFDRTHLWHMETVQRLSRSGGGFLIPTRFQVVTIGKRCSRKAAEQWWGEIAKAGEEGFVVKPLVFVPSGRRGLAQPALKCRTREHLRLVYGPNYDSRESLELLLDRGSFHQRRNKHRRILRQFKLSMEGLNRFIQRNSLDAVHECALGVLAEEVAPIERHKN